MRTVFISYYHAEDEWYRNAFQNTYGHLFISVSVNLYEIDDSNSTNYIKRLIQNNKLGQAQVLAVLVGPHTKNRRHVDWEISGALNVKVGEFKAGLMGILLPSFKLTPTGQFFYDDLPPRLADNARTGYADIYTWGQLTTSAYSVTQAIDAAFLKSQTHSHLIDNSREQFSYNRS